METNVGITYEQGEQIIGFLLFIQEAIYWILGSVTCLIGLIIVLIFFIGKGDINV